MVRARFPRYTPATLKKVLPYAPFLAAFYAYWEYFSEVGWEGLYADTIAFFTVENLKNNIATIVIVASFLLITEVVAALPKNIYLRTAIRAAAYYVGAKKIAEMVDAGSTTTGTTNISGLKTVAGNIQKSLANMISY